MQHSNKFENAMASIYMSNAIDAVEVEPIFVPPNIPSEWHEIIAEVVRTSPDMRIPNSDDLWEGGDIVQSPSAQTERECLVQSLAKDFAGKPHAEILNRVGPELGARVIEVLQSKAPTPKQILGKRQQMYREADAECGKALAAAGIQVKQHTEQEYMRVILAQLDSFLEGVILSVSELVRIVFPDDPAKAKSIRGSTRVKRWKDVYSSDAVRNHPMEIAMRLTHDKSCINGRLTARNFGQSLSVNMTFLKSCDRITKQGAEIDQLKARVQLLEQQMQATKQREALTDAGVTTPKDMVLSLHEKGVGPKMIAKQLGMELERVRSIIYRSKRA